MNCMERFEIGRDNPRRALCRPSGAARSFRSLSSGLRHWLNYFAAPRLGVNASHRISARLVIIIYSLALISPSLARSAEPATDLVILPPQPALAFSRRWALHGDRRWRHAVHVRGAPRSGAG